MNENKKLNRMEEKENDFPNEDNKEHLKYKLDE